MKIVEGNLLIMALEGNFDVIVHGCNCFCTMGAGIAKAIKEIFPEAYEADLKTEKGERKKLGTMSFAKVTRNSRELTIVNGYTQYDYRGKGIKANYEATRSVMKLVKQQYSGQRIGYPKIGSGLAGGDWNKISQIIDEELKGENHTLVVLPA
jgi:O-acetyl-ADP-ribose deacetylase (regulator of RNase III)